MDILFKKQQILFMQRGRHEYINNKKPVSMGREFHFFN
jgi:hypothetical protein